MNKPWAGEQRPASTRLSRNLAALPYLLVWCVLVLPSQPAHARDSVQWNTFKLQGYFNIADTGAGIGDKILAYTIDHLTEYDHTIGEMPLIRTTNTIDEVRGNAVLVPLKTKLPPKKLAQVISSTIQLVVPPPGLVVRKNDLDTLFSGGKALSIRAILNSDQRILFCWHRGATYHPEIRKAVEEYSTRRDTPNLTILSNYSNVFALLNAGRIDAFISHNHNFYAQYAILKEKMNLTEMVFIPVVECADDDVPCYTFANQTEQGRELIEKIDSIHNSQEYKTFIKGIIKTHFRPDQVDSYTEKNMRLIGTPMPN